jgi:phage shock protein B
MTEDAVGVMIAPFVIAILFIGLPWLLLHYLTKWKQAKTLTVQDEDLLDELHDLARRLDDRLNVIERIIAADRGMAMDSAIHHQDAGTRERSN